MSLSPDIRRRANLVKAIQHQVLMYKKKLGIQEEMRISFKNVSPKLLMQFDYGGVPTIEVNLRSFISLLKVDKQLTGQLFNWILAHEMLHTKQLQTYGVDTLRKDKTRWFEDLATEGANHLVNTSTPKMQAIIDNLRIKCQMQGVKLPAIKLRLVPKR